MLLIGSGSLMRFALTLALDLGIDIDLVCAQKDDGLLKLCARHNLPCLDTPDINSHYLKILEHSSDGVAFSINNPLILSDKLLSTDVMFFNIHNGLVQRYRGIAEVCVLAAICNSENSYGSTLHRLLPGQGVDAGPVIAQTAVEVMIHDSFDVVFTKSIENYKILLHKTFSDFASLSRADSSYLHGENVYTYRHVSQLLGAATPERRSLASNLGRYTGLLPRLAQAIHSCDY